jgi:hypothetical protein
MKRLLTVLVLSLTIMYSVTVAAVDGSTLRVVVVQTSDAEGYIAQLTEGKKLIDAVDKKFTIRAWQATFAGDATGTVIVGVEYPGSFGEFGVAWEKLISDPAVGGWLAGLSGLRTIVSDSIYNEYPL